MKQLTVGQMAKLNGVSIQTLRLYDKMGFFSPNLRDEDNLYRYYDMKQSAILDFIQHMKSMGIHLNEIKNCLENQNIISIEDALKLRLSQISKEFENLKYQTLGIERTLDSLEHYKKAPPDGCITLEYIEKRQMFYVDSDINIFDYELETYEQILRNLRNQLIDNNIPQIFFYNAGMSMSQKDLLEEKFYSSEAFVFIDMNYSLEKHIKVLSPNYYLCIYCYEYSDEIKYIGRLMEEIKEKGYQICGDYLCESMADIPAVDNKSRGMNLRLQIPITFK